MKSGGASQRFWVNRPFFILNPTMWWASRQVEIMIVVPKTTTEPPCMKEPHHIGLLCQLANRNNIVVCQEGGVPSETSSTNMDKLAEKL